MIPWPASQMTWEVSREKLLQVLGVLQVPGLSEMAAKVEGRETAPGLAGFARGSKQAFSDRWDFAVLADFSLFSKAQDTKVTHLPPPSARLFSPLIFNPIQHCYSIFTFLQKSGGGEWG